MNYYRKPNGTLHHLYPARYSYTHNIPVQPVQPAKPLQSASPPHPFQQSLGTGQWLGKVKSLQKKYQAVNKYSEVYEKSQALKSRYQNIVGSLLRPQPQGIPLQQPSYNNTCDFLRNKSWSKPSLNPATQQVDSKNFKGNVLQIINRKKELDKKVSNFMESVKGLKSTPIKRPIYQFNFNKEKVTDGTQQTQADLGKKQEILKKTQPTTTSVSQPASEKGFSVFQDLVLVSKAGGQLKKQ